MATPQSQYNQRPDSDWHLVHRPGAKLLDVRLLHTLLHDSVVCCVQFSWDGSLIATGGNRSTQIFNATTGETVCTLKDTSVGNAGDNYIRGVCFSPDGRFLATASEDRSIKIWDVLNERIHATFTGHQLEVYALVYSADGRIIASASGDNTVRIWNIEGFCKVLKDSDNDLHDAQNGYTSVAVSPDGRWVSAGDLNGVVKIWDIATGLIVERLTEHEDSAFGVAYVADGNGLVSASLDKTLRYWDVTSLVNHSPTATQPPAGSSTCTKIFQGHEDYIFSVATSPDNPWIVSGSKDRGVRIWDINDDGAVAHCTIKDAHNKPVIGVALSPKGNKFVTGGGDGRAKIWSLNQTSRL